VVCPAVVCHVVCPAVVCPGGGLPAE